MDYTPLLQEILATLQRIEAALNNRTGRAALGNVRVDLPVLSHGRRPKFWVDEEVRDFLTACHRRVEINDALKACAKRFGTERTPSRSALHRYWANLDMSIRRAA
jgi:hypothetical protein